MSNMHDDSILPVGTKVVLLPTSDWAGERDNLNPIGIVGTVCQVRDDATHCVNWSNGTSNSMYKHGPDIVPLQVYLVMRFKSFLESKGVWEGWNRHYSLRESKAQFFSETEARRWIIAAFTWSDISTWGRLHTAWCDIVVEVGA